MSKPTSEQIANEIKKLEDILPKVVPTSFFGDSNIYAIKMQIKVLKGGVKDIDELDQMLDMGDITDYNYNAARSAMQWRDIGDITPPSEDGYPLKK